jgi:hypothetical protein
VRALRLRYRSAQREYKKGVSNEKECKFDRVGGCGAVRFIYGIREVARDEVRKHRTDYAAGIYLFAGEWLLGTDCARRLAEG